MNLIHNTTVMDNRQLCADHFQLTLSDEGQLSRNITPGQFVNISIPERPDLTLRRPFSVARTKPDKNQLEIIYRIVGKGTRTMVGLKPGASLDVMGPLGNGWSTPEKQENCLLIGGGCGVAPLWGLAEQLTSNGNQVSALIGFQSKELVFGEDVLSDARVDVTVTTDDGTYGAKGFVVDHLETQLEKTISRVYICGPTPMAKSVIPELIERDIWGEVSLEEHMGCGFGVCLSCVANIKKESQINKERICTEGPVFSIREVIWEL